MTSKTHPRSPSPPPNAEQPALLKRLKSSHISEDPASTAPDQTPHFAPNLFVPSNIHRLHTEYENSGPFKHAVVEKLFQDDLLKNVKDEALAELSFSEKETDIYKVRSRAIPRSPRGYHASRLPSSGLAVFVGDIHSARMHGFCELSRDHRLIYFILSGLPNWRPRVALVPERAAALATSEPPHSPRCALLANVPQLPPCRHRMRPPFRHEAGHVRRVLPQRLPPSQP